ncbi:MAG: hypothetical protein DI556_06215 [Rhodovulum sulfidophilum]|uniref:Uncharacterized protein n=1 Tax=Rhodovulum sulfidophilum TaxID=35806 RepID=A0A2W5NB30_RHOSU|nr:MAG: hypothetical protein DI556_06215 [Rhodovulum sulfidophilum]
MPDARTFDVLNAIYLRKMAPVAHVADVAAIDAAAVEAILAEQRAAGAVLDLGGAWLLEQAGTDQVLAFYRETYRPLRERGDIMAWYEKFEATLNQQFIRAVSDWQSSEGDGRSQEKMIKLVDRMIRHLGQVTEEIPRYAHYIRRFEQSMARADRGERDFVCNPMVDSMHNVWFEFHEDILAVVGRPRDV